MTVKISLCNVLSCNRISIGNSDRWNQMQISENGLQKNYCRDGLGMFNHKTPSVLNTYKADKISMKMSHGLVQYGVVLTNFKCV